MYILKRPRVRAAGAACRRVLCVRVLVVTGRYRAGARIGISTDPRVVLGGSSPALETCHPWRLPSVVRGRGICVYGPPPTACPPWVWFCWCYMGMPSRVCSAVDLALLYWSRHLASWHACSCCVPQCHDLTSLITVPKREVSSRELGGLREAERVPPPTAAARHAEEDIAPLWSPTHGAALN